MRHVAVAVVTLLVFLALVRSAGAQYMYLDSNGDGLHSDEDKLSLGGETEADVWVDTTHNRDGSLATCAQSGSLTINSYTIALHANGGTVLWNPFSNDQSSMSISLGGTSSEREFFAGFGGGTQLAPGLYKLGHLTIEVTSGLPSIEISSSSSLSATFMTSFGSACEGSDGDNTLKFGSDWQDADGLAAPENLGFTMTAEADNGSETLSGTCYPGSSQFCTFTGRPSRFVHECGCPVLVDSVVFSCVLSYNCPNGTLAKGKPISVAVYPKQLTGGHCHADATRPSSIPSVQSGITDANDGHWEFRLVTPQVAGVLNLVVYSDDPSCPFNAARDTVATLCIRESGFSNLPPDTNYVELPGHAPENTLRHPDFHWGQPGAIVDLQQLVADFRKVFPRLGKPGINDMSLEWGGVFDIIDSTGCVAIRQPEGPYPNWISPHCAHRYGREIDFVIPKTALEEVSGWIRGIRFLPENMPGLPRKMGPHTFRAGPEGDHLHLAWK